MATLKGHNTFVNALTVLPDGRLASCSSDRTLKVWDLSRPKGQECVATLRGHTSAVILVTLLPDGRLVSCSADKTIKVWDLSKPKGQE